MFLPAAIVAALLCFLISGGNYITALTTALLMAVMVIACFVYHKPPLIKTTFVILLSLLLTGLFVSVLAPGNAVRQAISDQSGVITAITMSLRFAGSYVSFWDLRLVSALLFLSPIYYKMAQETSYPFKRPLLVILFSFCLYAAEYAPTAYAQSWAGEERVGNIIYFSYILLVFFNYFYVLGWLVRTMEEQQTSLGKGFLVQCAYGASIFAVVFILSSVLSFGEHTFAIAARDLYNGTAKQYALEIDEYYKILHDDSIKRVELPPVSVEPQLLSFGLFTTDKHSNWNRSVARAYQKEYVVVNAE
ncbi:MAG: hypothetical protein LBI54_05350 [Lachnospiraceae bacterium]|jgi:hypothetical protein|nr:hypothetical protein [Lachnospiraceae bacterium]